MSDSVHLNRMHISLLNEIEDTIASSAAKAILELEPAMLIERLVNEFKQISKLLL